MKQRAFLFVFIVSIIVALFIYKDSFSSYFFQDDWFSFRISRVQSVGDFFNFFVPRTDVVYYRPLGMQLPFWVMRTLFGLTPFPYRVLTFFIHLVNAFLVYKLINLITHKVDNAYLSMFLYATTATIFIPMYWFATFAFVLGPLAVFVSLLGYILWLDNSKSKFIFLSFAFFTFGLFIFEVAAVTSFLMLLVSIIRKKISLKYITVIGFLTGVFFAIRFLVVSPASTGAYEIALGRNIMTNLKSFFLWSFNWSEILTEQMQRPFIFNAVIEENFPIHAKITVIATIIILTLLLLPAFLYRKTIKQLPLRLIIVGALWFIVGLLPVLPFTHHKFSYYIPVALVGLLLIVSVVSEFVKEMHRKFALRADIYMFSLLCCWIILSVTTLDLNRRIHWAPRRAILAKEWVDSALKLRHVAWNLVFVDKNEEVKWALNHQDAMRVVFGNNLMVTVYGEDKNEVE